MITILVVEDDRSIRLLTRARLKPFYNILEAEDGEKALDLFYKEHVDLIVADIMMPNMDGFELVRTLREYKQNVPVIFLTAKTSFEDKKEGFKSGIDDYMTKPVDYEELRWRIDALLRRANINTVRRIEIGNVVVDESNYTVYRITREHDKADSENSAENRNEDGELVSIELPKKEFELLYKLLSYPGQIFTKDQLLSDIWGLDTDTGDSTIKTHINRLRSKFGDWPEFSIITIRGLGYKAEIYC